MKTQISRDTFQPARHYSGVQLQQGRMIVDADWNELDAIVRSRLEAALADAVSSGAPRAGGLALFLDGANLRLRPGRLYVDGLPAALDGPAAGLALTAQPDYPNAPPLPAGDLRFYADVWERSVSALEDPALMDPGLHGADTASRSQTMLQVKWCLPATDPLDADVNPPLGNAPLSLRLRSIATAGDPCDPCAAEVEVDERIGNYLFRVEVHDVAQSGGNTLLTLKWSRDNGAEAYAVGFTPAGFGQGSWVWEYFDAATEKQLGNHLTAAFQPRRGTLSETFDTPTGAGDPKTFVRQWDGYATINLTTGVLVGGMDRGAALSAALAALAHGHVEIAGGTLAINLELLELSLPLAGRRFLPGDYWLATVREAVQASGDLVLDAAPPAGVRHHYLELGQRIGGALVPPPGVTADAHRRRLAFPPLADVHAADVAFTEPAGCSGLYAGAPNVQEALARICQIGAEDIGFTLPEPLPPNTVASLLANQLGAGWPDLDGQPKTPSVQDMLLALLLQANAGALPYTLPACTATPNTVGQLLGLAPGPSTVGSVLQQLLCNFTGDRLPLNPATLTCTDLLESGETTVQGGLDFLCRTRLSSCSVAVPVGQLDTLLREFAASARTDLWLCLMPGEHPIGAALALAGKRSLRISAAAAGASAMVLQSGVVSLEAQELGLEGIRVQCASGARMVLRANRIVASRCAFTRTSSNPALPPMLRLEARAANAELIWRDNLMSDTWSRPIQGGGTVFDPDLVGNATVNAALDVFRNNAGIFEDQAAYRTALDGLTDAVAGMSGSDRLAWRNRVNAGATGGTGTGAIRDAATGRGATISRALTSDTLAVRSSDLAMLSTDAGRLFASGDLFSSALLADTQPLLARASVGSGTVESNRATVSGAIDRINAAGNNRAEIAEILADDIIVLLYEFGYGIALGIASNQLSGSLTDNHFDGEVLLMNGLESGLDPRDVTLTQRTGAAAQTPVNGSGHLSLTGNRIRRLWTRLPNGSVSGNALTQTVPGYGSVSLSGNQLIDYGHSLAAAVLTMQGNRLINRGAQNGPAPIGRFVTNRAALTGNVAEMGEDFSFVTVAANILGNAANVLVVSKI